MTGESRRVKKLRRAAFQRQGGLCHWCQQPMLVKTQANADEVWDHPRVCTADHVVWRSTGGQTTADNIVAACRECNNSRHAPEDQPTRKPNGAVTYTKEGFPIVPACG